MKSIIIYGTHTGFSEKYALQLSKKTNIDAVKYDEVKNINDYEQIIYIGGLYAGGVVGLKNTLKNLKSFENIIIISVGLADTKNTTNTNNIKESLKKQIPTNIYEKAKFFHLRGGIDYSKLSFKHKILMKLLYEKTKRIPMEEQTEENKNFIETYDKKVDFTDFEELNEIVKSIKN